MMIGSGKFDEQGNEIAGTPVRVYYHCALLNHWRESVITFLDKLIESGLYEKCETIHFGVVGSNDNHLELKLVLMNYPKVEIRQYSPTLKDGEFHTLVLLKSDADTRSKFHAIYAHTKGVSWGKERNEADYEYMKFWREYMLWGVVTRWKDNYRALEMPDSGYDIACVRAVPKRKSITGQSHNSGNFFFANSEYIKTLPPIPLREPREPDGLKYEGGFACEMWSFRGEPLVYIICNAFMIGFPHEKTFNETIKTFPINDYCTR